MEVPAAAALGDARDGLRLFGASFSSCFLSVEVKCPGKAAPLRPRACRSCELSLFLVLAAGVLPGVR